MHVLVAYASRHGATEGIAERIAETLLVAGIDAEAKPAASIKSLSGYDAFVVGSAAYMNHWLGDARDFVRRHRAELTAKPLWMFSSGPIGTEPVNDKGIDQKVATIPQEIPELVLQLKARDHHVFFGAYERDRKPIGLAERFAALMPATVQNAMPFGDFRNWPEIEGWADAIARELLAGQGRPVAPQPPTSSAPRA